MSNTWHYRHDGVERGPVSPAELKRLAATGGLEPDDKVWREGMEKWVPARTIKGLFPDASEQVQAVAGHVEKAAKTVRKVASATGEVADAVTEMAETGDKVQKAFTAVAGLSAGGSTLLGGVGDFLRPLGPVNLLVFAVAVLSAVVLFVVARQKGAKVKVRVKLGTVASLVVALVFGLWSGLGAVAGKDNKGVLATNFPAIERAQAAVLPVQQPPVVERPAPADEVKVGEVRRFEVPPAVYQWVAFSPDGKRVLYCGLSPTIANTPRKEHWLIEWEWESGKELRRVLLPEREFGDAAFSRDRKWVVLMTHQTNGDDLLWDVEGGRSARPLPRPGKGHTRGAFTSGQYAVLCSFDAIARVDTSTGKLVRKFEGADVSGSFRVATSPDGRQAYTAAFARPAQVWDAVLGKPLREVGRPQRTQGRPVFAPDSRHVLDGGKGDVRLWDVDTGKEAGSFDGLDEFRCAAFSKDGKLLVTGHAEAGSEGDIRVWDVAGRKEIVRLKGHSERCGESLDVSPDGTHAVSSGQDGTVRVWRLPKADGGVAVRPAADPVPPPGNDGEGAAKGVRPVKGWVSLMDTPEQVQLHWRHGDSKGFFLYDADRQTMTIENWFGLGTLVHPAPWREFRCEVDVPDRHETKFELKVHGTRLDIGPALFAGKFPAEVAVKYDPETEEVQASIGGLVVQKEKAKRPRRGESFECEFFTFQGPRSRDQRNLVLVRKARLLVLEHESRPETVAPPAAGKTSWLPLCETQEQVFQHWKHGHYNHGSMGTTTKVATSRYDPKEKAITLGGRIEMQMGQFRHKGRWKQFECRVEPGAAWGGRLDLVVNLVALPVGPAISSGKVHLVTVRLDEDRHLLTAEVDGKVVSQATVTEPSWRDHTYDGIDLGNGFTCGFHLGKPSRDQGEDQIAIREARLLAIDP